MLSRQQLARTRLSKFSNHQSMQMHSSEAEWSGTRLLTGDSEVRFLPLEPHIPVAPACALYT
jgi:hypothetical protein